MDDIARRIVERRREMGLRQEDLARLAGVSRARVIAIEQGSPALQIDKLRRVLDVLGLVLTVERREPPP